MKIVRKLVEALMRNKACKLGVYLESIEFVEWLIRALSRTQQRMYEVGKTSIDLGISEIYVENGSKSIGPYDDIKTTKFESRQKI